MCHTHTFTFLLSQPKKILRKTRTELENDLTMSLVSLLDAAKMIDHSLLKPELTTAEVEAGCELAKKYNCASVCVRPCDISVAASILRDTSVKVGTVIGFPHGSVTTAVKVFEAEEAVKLGAVELDLVINISWIRSGRFAEAQAEVAAVVDVAKRAVGSSSAVLVKVILENAYLNHEQKVAAYRLVEAAGGAFVKTSTGYAPTGSTPADLQLMRATVSSAVQVKGAGGIRTLDALLEARACGASRIGATATAQILEDFQKRDPEGKGLPLPAVAPAPSPSSQVAAAASSAGSSTNY